MADNEAPTPDAPSSTPETPTPSSTTTPSSTPDAAKPTGKAAAKAKPATPDAPALVPGPETPGSSQFGTHDATLAEAEKVRGLNSPADLAGGSYATTATAAPLTPSDQVTQVVPHLGNASTSTNPVAASTGGAAALIGERHLELVGEDGAVLGADDLFDDPGPDQTYVTARTRIHERFAYPGTTEHQTRLMFTAGARVRKEDAARIRAAINAHAAAQA